MATIAPLISRLELDVSPYTAAAQQVLGPTAAMTTAIQQGSAALADMATAQTQVGEASKALVDVAALTDAQTAALQRYLETGGELPSFLAAAAAGQGALTTAQEAGAGASAAAGEAAQTLGTASAAAAEQMGAETAAAEQLAGSLGQIGEASSAASGGFSDIGGSAGDASEEIDSFDDNTDVSSKRLQEHARASSEAGEALSELKNRFVEVTGGVLPGLGLALQNAQSAWHALTTDIEAGHQQLTTMGAGLLAVGLGLKGLSFEAFTRGVGEIHLTAQMVGLADQELAGFQFAMESTGASTDRTTMALSRINMQLQVANEQLASGQAPAGNLVKALDELGISLTNGEGHVKTLSALLPEVAERFKALNDEAKIGGPAFDASGVAVQLFSRTGATMVPVLLQGREGIAEWTAKVREMGLASEEQIGRIEGVRRSEAELDLATKALASGIGSDMVPSFERMAAVGLTVLGFLNQLPGPVKEMAINVPIAAGGFLLIAGAMGQLVTSAAPVFGALSSIGSALYGVAAANMALVASLALNPIFWLAVAAAVGIAIIAFQQLQAAHAAVAASSERVSSAEKIWLDAAEQSRATTGDYKTTLAALAQEHDALAEKVRTTASLTGQLTPEFIANREALDANEKATADLTSKQGELEAVQARVAQTTGAAEGGTRNFAIAMKAATEGVTDQGVELRNLLKVLDEFPGKAREVTDALLTMGKAPTSEEIELNRQTTAFKQTVADLKVELADTGPMGAHIAKLQEDYDRMVQAGEGAKKLAEAQQFIAGAIANSSDPALAEQARGLQQQIDEGNKAIENLGLQKEAYTAHREALLASGEAATTTAPAFFELDHAVTAGMEALAGVPEQVEGTMGGVAEQAHAQGQEVGRQLDAGITAGITEGEGAVREAARIVVQHAIDTANETAGTHSPSTKTKQTGIDWTTGLAEGIRQMEAESSGAATHVVSRANAAATAAAADVSKTAIAGFEHELVSSQSYYEGLVGKTGAGLMSALATAVADNSAGGGQAVGRALQQIADKLQEAKIGDWQTQANALAGLLHDALINRTPESVAAAAAMVSRIDDELAAAKLWQTFERDARAAAQNVNQAIENTGQRIVETYQRAGEQIKSTLQQAADTRALEAARGTIESLVSDMQRAGTEQETLISRQQAAADLAQRREDQAASTELSTARQLVDVKQGHAQSLLDLRAGHEQRLADIARTAQGQNQQQAYADEARNYDRQIKAIDDQTARQLLAMEKQAARAEQDRAIQTAVEERDRAQADLRADEATARQRARTAAEAAYKASLEASFGIAQSQVEAEQTRQRIEDIQKAANIQADEDRLALARQELASAIALRDKLQLLAVDNPNVSTNRAVIELNQQIANRAGDVASAGEALAAHLDELRSAFDTPSSASVRISQVWSTDIPAALKAAQALADQAFAAQLHMSEQTLANERATVALLQGNVTAAQQGAIAGAGAGAATERPGSGGAFMQGFNTATSGTTVPVATGIGQTAAGGVPAAPATASTGPMLGSGTALSGPAKPAEATGGIQVIVNVTLDGEALAAKVETRIERHTRDRGTNGAMAS